jgi:hypothetical protein
MDMPTLAALLGHSKLNVVMRNVHKSKPGGRREEIYLLILSFNWWGARTCSLPLASFLVRERSALLRIR